jgi:hypothetical protein
MDKKKALEKFKTAAKKHDPQLIISGAEKYARECEIKGTEKQFIKHPTTFLNAESFLNDFDLTGRGGSYNAKDEAARRFTEEYNLPF